MKLRLLEIKGESPSDLDRNLGRYGVVGKTYLVVREEDSQLGIDLGQGLNDTYNGWWVDKQDIEGNILENTDEKWEVVEW